LSESRFVKCPFKENCLNADSWKCKNFCYSRIEVNGNVLESFRAFKDKEYYAKTIPYIRLKELFEADSNE